MKNHFPYLFAALCSHPLHRPRTFAQECCVSCGCGTCIRKVSPREVRDRRKSRKEYLPCECEDFCVPGPSKKCG